MNPTAPTSHQHPGSHPPEEIHLQDYVHVLLRRRRVFVIAFLMVFLAVAAYTFTMKPVYEASATLHVKTEKGMPGALGQLAMLDSANPVDAEIEILKSRTNAEEVVKRLHLDWAITPANGGMACSLLDFASRSREPVYQLEITGRDTYAVSDNNDKPVGTGRVGVLFHTDQLTLLVSELRGKTGDRCRLQLLPFNPTVAGLQRRIRASELGKKTNIIRVSTTGTNPALAKQIVNTLVQAYLEQTVAFKTEEASRTVQFVEEQLKGLRNELDTAELNLQGFKSAAGVVKLDTEANALINKFSDMEKERTEASLQKKQVEFALNSLKDAARRGVTYSPAVMMGDPLIAGMAGKLADLEVQRRALTEEYTKDHPQVRAVQAQIDELQHKIQATYETAQKNLGKQEEDLTKRIGYYEGNLKRLPVAERELVKLTRLAKVNADIYTFLLNKHEEARIAKASTISNINIVDPAITPELPIKPRKAKNLILGLMVGLMLGVGLAFFQEYLDDTIKDGDQAKRLLGIPVLGTINHIQMRADEADSRATMVVYNEPKSIAAEAFRSLRTSLHFSAINRDKKILLVTSTFPGEGKSTVATNLALTLSQTGARVLIIDGDLRRPSLHEKFGFAKAPGLTEVLAGDVDLERVLWPAPMAGLFCLPSGTNPPNPAELLGSEKMEQLLTSLSERYDHIVIDAPPVLAVTDAPLLTGICDLVLVVLEAGRVPVKAALRMQEMLASVHARVAGMVINDKSGRGETYGGYGYRYGYGYSYGYYSDEDKPQQRGWWSRIRKAFLK
jgi:tyrosine-protein kinase Etk/Wzc